MELITGDVEAFHCGFADFDALLVAARVERAFDLQTGRGGRGPDQFDDGNASCQRPAAPVLRDVAEQPVLDLVPFRCAGRIVVDADHEPGFVGQFLQFELPEAHTGTIRAAAVCSDRQFPCIGIALSSHAFEPAADRLHGELGGVAGDPDADESGVGGHIVHAIGHHLAELLVLEVVHVHALRIAFGTIISSAILEVANQSFFLVSTEMTGCCWACAAMTFALMYSNWAFRSGCFEPSSALRFDWRENPSFTNSAHTVSALIGCPIRVRVAASFSMLFDTQINGRMGSPNVAGSTKRLSAGMSPGSFSQTERRPPPARRTCPFGSGGASRSCLPRLIVERASPVIFETITRPPRPAVRTSAAAKRRRPRSSSREPTTSHRSRIAASSIMQSTYPGSPKTGIPNT